LVLLDFGGMGLGVLMDGSYTITVVALGLPLLLEGVLGSLKEG
jgi:hypothetical protein